MIRSILVYDTTPTETVPTLTVETSELDRESFLASRKNEGDRYLCGVYDLAASLDIDRMTEHDEHPQRSTDEQSRGGDGHIVEADPLIAMKKSDLLALVAWAISVGLKES